MRIGAWIGLFSVFLGSSATAADWKPGTAPLMTRWAKDVKPDSVHPEYPRPQFVRKDWLNLNGLWQLAAATKDEAPPIGTTLSEQILVPFPVESALSGVMKRGERWWYRRTFTIPKTWSGKRTLLHFGAVDWEATVWVNGKKLGDHRGGYDGFSFDITDALKSEGDQEIIVGVYDPTDKGTQPRGKQVNNPRGIYYTPTTGFWQTVWLEPVKETYIERLDIVPDIDAGKATIKARIKGNTDGMLLLAAARVKTEIEFFPGPRDHTIVIPIPQAKLWSPESPFLYDVDIRLIKKDVLIDNVKTYFGMRKTSVGKDDKGVTRLFLNNKPYFQLGPLDQGFWPDGLYTAPTDEALKYDIEMTKKLGFNTCRKHVKVEPERWYYWCDKLGLLVWQDMPSGDKSVRPNQGEIQRSPESAKQYELELKRMIDGRRNHPCIIMWVVFNEGWGQFDTARITKLTKEYDPSRLVDCASGWNDMKVGDVHDIHVYPGPGVPPTEPNRAAVLGEFGGLGLKIDNHMWIKDKSWGYRQTTDIADLTRRYERLLAEVWKLKAEKGLSAAVYTQTTDVESEVNGLMTYDRDVVKMTAERVTAVNKGDVSRIPQVRTIVPTSRKQGLPWRYTFRQPVGDWQKPGYDASNWKEGTGGFGTKGTPGAVARTEWKTDHIWIRREFTLPEGPLGNLFLSLHHDEDVEVYLNGVLAAKESGFITDYQEVAIAPEARATLKPGKNLIAIHCRQTKGGQYIDAGIVELVPPKQK